MKSPKRCMPLDLHRGPRLADNCCCFCPRSGPITPSLTASLSASICANAAARLSQRFPLKPDGTAGGGTCSVECPEDETRTCPGHAEWTRGVVVWGLWESDGVTRLRKQFRHG